MKSNIEKGKEIFMRCCSQCHSIDSASHKMGRSLLDNKYF